MKLVIIGLVVAAAIALGSFFGGWSFARKSQEVTELNTQMNEEHVELSHKLDALGTKMEAMDKKLDILINIAVRPLAYELDSKQ